MTDEEWGVWNTITRGLGTNDPNPPDEVLDWAIGLGEATSVSMGRVIEIFEAIMRGVQPGTPPL
ncbi:MAG TPA: hypothetical protein VJ743_07805 [Albitalea sp.]|nr:hypothetical protein [Albitalea sp.]